MRFMIAAPEAFYPQFATHNAHAVASARVAGGGVEFEYQRLHGMGEALYEAVLTLTRVRRGLAGSTRLSAGTETSWATLLRRLLENGANTSFVNRLADEETPVSDIIADPVEIAERERLEGVRKTLLVRPRDIYLPDRKASAGVPLTETGVRSALLLDISKTLKTPFAVGPIVNGVATTGGASANLLLSPHDRRERVGSFRLATPAPTGRGHRIGHRRGAQLGYDPVCRAGARAGICG